MESRDADEGLTFFRFFSRPCFYLSSIYLFVSRQHTGALLRTERKKESQFSVSPTPPRNDVLCSGYQHKHSGSNLDLVRHRTADCIGPNLESNLSIFSCLTRTASVGEQCMCTGLRRTHTAREAIKITLRKSSRFFHGTSLSRVRLSLPTLSALCVIALHTQVTLSSPNHPSYVVTQSRTVFGVKALTDKHTQIER